MHRDIVRGYVHQFAERVAPTGIIFIDDAGEGAKSTGRRTDIHKEDIQTWAAEVGLVVVNQSPRNNKGDYISILRRNLSV